MHRSALHLRSKLHPETPLTRRCGSTLTPGQRVKPPVYAQLLPVFAVIPPESAGSDMGQLPDRDFWLVSPNSHRRVKRLSGSRPTKSLSAAPSVVSSVMHKNLADQTIFLLGSSRSSDFRQPENTIKRSRCKGTLGQSAAVLQLGRRRDYRRRLRRRRRSWKRGSGRRASRPRRQQDGRWEFPWRRLPF